MKSIVIWLKDRWAESSTHAGILLAAIWAGLIAADAHQGKHSLIIGIVAGLMILIPQKGIGNVAQN